VGLPEPSWAGGGASGGNPPQLVPAADTAATGAPRTDGHRLRDGLLAKTRTAATKY